MRKFLGTAIVGGALAAASVAATGTAAATPPPPSPVCTIVAYPLVFLVEATGGKTSPLLPILQPISDAVCK
ncbi:hypothetical protein [Nocardia sp. NPDC050406]|uniref:hypothetical protein n=1 Tax=Nocardia sp. NPDC050406 TaxID=3364318 RepID=UPI0037AD7BB4